MESLISEIHIYEERQPNGQWLKSIKFKLPIIEEDMSLSLDNDTHIEMSAVDGNRSTRHSFHYVNEVNLHRSSWNEAELPCRALHSVSQ